MPNPKRRHSRARRDRRRSHDALTQPGVMWAPCWSTPGSWCYRYPHRVCDTCGYYGARKVTAGKEDA